MKIKPTLIGFSGELVLVKSLESANYNHENPPNTMLNRFLKLNSVEHSLQV